MSHLAKTGRNDPCPCGSGRKFKRCCETKVRAGSQTSSRLMLLAVAGAVLAALLLGIASFTSDSQATGPRRVWSAEHGHYHDVP